MRIYWVFLNFSNYYPCKCCFGCITPDLRFEQTYGAHCVLTHLLPTRQFAPFKSLNMIKNKAGHV